MQVPVVINRSSPIPLHRQIYERWRDGILDRRFGPGDRVPSTRELASALGVSRATATAAYEQLAAEGYFETAAGSGTFICGELPDAPVEARTAGRRGLATPPVRLSAFGRRLPEAPAPAEPGGRPVVNLSRFGPDLSRFPFPLWRRLVARHLREARPALFARGTHEAGFPPLRQQIAAYLKRARAVRCEPEQVIVVNGSQQALDLCMRLFVDPGDEVAMESPGYTGVRELALACGARLTPAGVTPQGVNVADLRGAPRLLHVTPSHQFPTGVAMSLARRLELLEWASERGTILIEDDYDSEYRYSGPPLPALQGLADDVPVIYVGTFSNVTFPAIRLGYVVVPPALAEAFVRAKWLSDRHTPLVDQAALADFMREGHFERHVRRMRRLYGSRRAALVASLERHFGDEAVVRGEAAGMHALVAFQAADIRARARREGVRIVSADACYASGRSPGEFIVGFAASSERTLAEGVRRLAAAGG